MDAKVETAAPRPLTHQESRLITFGVLLPLFMGSLDNTILASALPTIGRAFGDTATLPWLITGYLLAATAGMPLYGKLADIYGRRTMLCVAILIHMSASVVCAFAPSLLVLILGRTLAGHRRGRALLDQRRGAGRCRRAEGSRALLRLFLHHLHDRRRARARARRLHGRSCALVVDLLAQYPARPARTLG